MRITFTLLLLAAAALLANGASSASAGFKGVNIYELAGSDLQQPPSLPRYKCLTDDSCVTFNGPYDWCGPVVNGACATQGNQCYFKCSVVGATPPVPLNGKRCAFTGNETDSCTGGQQINCGFKVYGTCQYNATANTCECMDITESIEACTDLTNLCEIIVP